MAETQPPQENLMLTFRVADAPESAAPARSRWLVWCVAGVAMGLGFWWVGRQFLTGHLVQQVATADSRDQALLALQGLALLGDDAIAPLTQTLAHQDIQIARAAYRLLDARLTQWQNAPGDYQAQLLNLSKLLHQLPDTALPDRLGLASSLATRIQVVCDGTPQIDMSETVAFCDQLIQRAVAAQFAPLPTATGRPPATSGSPTSPQNQSPQLSASASAVPPPLPPAATPQAGAASLQISDHGFTDASGGGLTASLSDGPEPLRPYRDAIHSSTGAPRATVQLVQNPTQPRGVGTKIVSETAAEYPAPDDSVADYPDDDESRSAELWSAPTVATLQQPLQNAASIDLASIASLPTDQLVRLLGSTQDQVAQTAALRLRALGMEDSSLQLASELATASVSRKLELTAQIASRTDLDPQPWLLWMAEDSAPAVRRQAVSLLQQMSDGRVAIALRRLLDREADPTVAQTIRQVLAQNPGLPLR